MLKIKKVRFKNLLSYGNYWTEIVIDQYQKTLIIGKNGSGKSTLIEALVFGLYGKPYRKINKPQLINSITNKQLVVEIEFSIGSDNYSVIRGIKPNIFEVYQNNDLLNQEGESKNYQDILETQILKKSYKTFTQVDILGSAKYTSFMELPAPQRREIVEDLLDLHIFSNMNTVAKNRFKEITDQISENQTKLEITEVNLDKLIKIQQASTEIYLEQIKQLKQSIEKNTQQKTIHETELYELNDQLLQHDVDKLKNDIKTMITQKNDMGDHILRAEITLNNVQRNITFFCENDDCPTCNQKIDQDFKNKTVENDKIKQQQYQDIIEKLKQKKQEITTDLEGLTNKISETNDLQQLINKKISQISNIDSILSSDSRKIYEYQQKINQTKTDVSGIDKLKNDIKTLNKELSDDKQTKNNLSVILTSLKDTGVKAVLIKEYIPVLNQLITKYLNKMNFIVSFELTETFEEIIKSRYRDEFSYGSFSEGQKNRINLALLLAFRDIARSRNSVASNLLLMDEVFDSSLDNDGMEDMLGILNDLTTTSNIIIISHKTDEIIDSFDRVIEFSLNKNFSVMKELL